MAFVCHIIVENEVLPEGAAYRQRVFEEVPRIGETVLFSRDGKRDDRGVLHPEHFTVTNVWHLAGDDKSDPRTMLIVEELTIGPDPK